MPNVTYPNVLEIVGDWIFHVSFHANQDNSERRPLSTLIGTALAEPPPIRRVQKAAFPPRPSASSPDL